MDTKQTYTVAGHSFCFVNKENDPMWERMISSYAPFMDKGVRDMLFTLTMCDELPEAENARPVYMNSNPNSKEAKIDIYRTLTGHLFKLTPHGGGNNEQSLLHVSADFSVARLLPRGDEAARLCGINTALMLCYLLATLGTNTALIHASTVVCEGKSYLFLGRSGTGKSTHSGLWKQYIPGTELLNDDHPVVRIDPAGQAIAYGSPWSGKSPCYRNESAPVGGIVHIRRASKNQIRRLSRVEAYASLLTSCLGMSWDIGPAEGKHNTLQRIITSVPCYTLSCLPDRETAVLCARAVRKPPLAEVIGMETEDAVLSGVGSAPNTKCPYEFNTADGISQSLNPRNRHSIHF